MHGSTIFASYRGIEVVAYCAGFLKTSGYAMSVEIPVNRYAQHEHQTTASHCYLDDSVDIEIMMDQLRIR